MGFRGRNQRGEQAKKESKKVDELGSGKKSPVPRHAQKAEPKPKRAPKKTDPAGALTKAEAAASLWAKPKAPKKKK